MEHVTEGSWESLPIRLHPLVLGALRELGFPYMTPVQVPGAAGRGRVLRAPGRGGGSGGAGRLRAWDFCRVFRLPTLVNDPGGGGGPDLRDPSACESWRPSARCIRPCPSSCEISAR